MVTPLASTHPTLLDLARITGPDGNIAKVAEILNQYNEMLDDITFVPGNLPTGHKTTVRSSIPAGTWRLLNQGIVPVKSQANQITDTCGMLENYSEIDCALAKLNGNSAEWRLSEDKAIIEGMGQSFQTALIYGDTSVNPERFVGLAPRYYSLGATTGGNIIDAGGTGSNDNTSIWLVGWSTDTIHGIFPKGSQAGLSMKDLGEQTIYDANLGRYQGYRTHYKHDVGLTIRDWRFVVRIANINITDLLTAGDAADASANILKYMSMALDKFPPIGNVRPVFYMNQTVRSMLRVKLMSRSNTFLTLENWMSPTGMPRPTLTFMGVPCRRVDAITSTEARIV
jgi:hypothetical protein